MNPISDLTVHDGMSTWILPFKLGVWDPVNFFHSLGSISCTNNFSKCFYYLKDCVRDIEYCIMGALYKYCLKFDGGDSNSHPANCLTTLFFPPCLFACHPLLYNEWVTVIVAGKIIMQRRGEAAQNLPYFEMSKASVIFWPSYSLTEKSKKRRHKWHVGRARGSRN